jgi:nucleoid-associated protein YgaU
LVKVAALACLIIVVISLTVRAVESSRSAGRIDYRTYVVRPGDTLISIAERYDGGGNPYPLVERLIKETGSARIFPGERLKVPVKAGS